MATANVNTLLNQVSPFVGRCPENLQLWALRTAARQFFLDTELLEETLADIATVDEQKEYTLTSEYALMNFKRVVTVYVHEDDAETTEDVDKTGELRPDQWKYDGNTTLTLDPAPVIDDYDIQVTVIYEPQMDCVLYPDYILNRWGQHISYYALYALRKDPIDPNEPAPWYSPEGSQQALQMYRQGVGDIKRLILSQNQSGRIDAVQMRAFT